MYEIFKTAGLRRFFRSSVFVFSLLFSGLVFLPVSFAVETIIDPTVHAQASNYDTIFYSDDRVFFFNFADVVITSVYEGQQFGYQISLNPGKAGYAFVSCTPVRVDCNDFGTFNLAFIIVTDSSGNFTGFHSTNPNFLAPDTSFLDVPNPLTDPTGFVAAVLHNTGLTIASWFLPPDNYFFNKVSEIGTTWETDQPGLASINTAFSDGVSALSSPTSLAPVTLGSLHFGNSTIAAVPFFDPSAMDSGIFSQAKTLISAFMYFGVAFWVIREVSTIMSA